MTQPQTLAQTSPQLQDLLEAGVHFGHQTRRWNPKMRRFIFAERSGIYIIDLQKTLRQIQAAQELIRGVVLKGEGTLFVCTKKQLKNIIQAEAQRCGAFWVTERWLGGTLTNFQTIKRQIKRLKDLEQGISEGEFEHHTKKEQLLFERERGKLEKYFSGIKNMARLPGALFVVDSKKERIAAAEARGDRRPAQDGGGARAGTGAGGIERRERRLTSQGYPRGTTTRRPPSRTARGRRCYEE